MAHHTPVEYRLVLEVAKQLHRDPNPYMIENLAYKSDEPFFRTDEFWVALRTFRLEGTRPKKPVYPNAERELRMIDQKLHTFEIR